MVFFAVQKPLSLIRSHLFIFAFISFILGEGAKKKQKNKKKPTSLLNYGYAI